MAPQWIDFKTLREMLSFKDVLDHYKVELKAKGKEQHSAYCPLPNHQGHGSGRTLSVNLKRGLWKCWGCGEGGNALDFAVRMEGLNPGHPADVRTVALMLAERFRIVEASAAPIRRSVSSQGTGGATTRANAPKPTITVTDSKDMPQVVNAPLDFELKGLDPEHPFFDSKGLKPETVRHFGLGYCSRGMLAGRIAIPLHDATGKLVGYAGRLADPSKATASNRKYVFPEDRVRNGVMHLFRKQLLVYNLHRFTAPMEALIIVPGFTALWRLWQSGFKDVVAIMGDTCSSEQARLLTASMSASGRLRLVIKDNVTAQPCAASIFRQTAHRCFVRLVVLPNDEPFDEVLLTDLRNELL